MTKAQRYIAEALVKLDAATFELKGEHRHRLIDLKARVYLLELDINCAERRKLAVQEAGGNQS